MSYLATNDYVVSRSGLRLLLLASTVFFFVERQDVSGKWRTSLTVAGLVTGIAFGTTYTWKECGQIWELPLRYLDTLTG